MLEGERGPVRRYVVAAAAVAAAWLLRATIGGPLLDRYPFMIFYFAIIIAAWYGGAGPAALAVALGLIAVGWAVNPFDHAPWVMVRDQPWKVVVYLAFGTLISALGGLYHAARRRAAAHAANAARLLAEAQSAVERHRTAEDQLALLAEASSSLSSSLEPPAVLSAIVALARRLIAADAYAVWRLTSDSGTWSIDRADGLSERYERMVIERFEPGRPVPPEPIVANDVFQTAVLANRQDAYRAEGIRSLLSVPLRVRGTLGGSLVFYFRSPHTFTPVEVRVATALGNLAAAAIGSANLYEEAREADRRKDEFLAMLAHELRNPLAPLRNALHILALPDLGPTQVEQVRAVMHRQTEHLVRMVDDLLDVSRLLRGKIGLRPTTVDVADAVRRAVETAQPAIDALGHELSIDLPPDPLPVRGDLIRLAQVFANLLQNAAKFTEHAGRIRLTAARENGEVVVRVRDSGVGISPELLPKVFDLFVQADRSPARTQGGLGIGLTLVQRLVELHGGTVEAHSEGFNRGSEFVVRLPASVEVPDSPPVNGDRRAGSCRRLRVLVVDDNVDAAQSLAAVLGAAGHTVRTAHNGPAAVGAAVGLRPDAVVLDIGLPGMDGYAVAKALKQGPSAGAVLIALTGYGQDEDRRRSKEAGIDHHLVKPVDPAELMELLAETAAAGVS